MHFFDMFIYDIAEYWHKIKVKHYMNRIYYAFIMP